MSGFGKVVNDGGVVISTTHRFANAGERDAYFPSNLDELVNTNNTQTYIAVGALIERWDGPNKPAAYDNTNWTDVTAVFEGPKGDKGDKGDPGDETQLIDDTTPKADRTYSSNKIETLEALLTKAYGTDGRVRFDDTEKHWFFEVQETPGNWVQKFEIGGSATVDVINFIEGLKPTVVSGDLGLYNKAITIPGDVDTLELRIVDPEQKEYGIVFHDKQTGQLNFIESDGSFGRAAKFSDIPSGGATTFDQLTDTPANKNVPEIRNVVVNPFVQQLEYRLAQLSDNSDIQFGTPESGEILSYDGLKWINASPRLVAALSSFNSTDYITDIGNASISFIYANDNNIIDIDTPANVLEGDIIIAINMNLMFDKVININARQGETINGGSTYSVQVEHITFFVRKGTDWKFGGENKYITSLSTQVATNLSDITSSGSGSIITTAERDKLTAITNTGSGQIITAAERTKLADCCSTGVPIEITDNLTIDANNYTTYNNKLIQGKKSGILVVDLAQISTFNPTGRILFTFVNNSPSSNSMDIRAGGSDTIKGAFFYRLRPNESVTIEFPASGTEWLVISESSVGDPVPIYSTNAVSIPVSGNDIFVKYVNLSPPDVIQPLPALNTVGNDMNLYFYLADSNTDHTVTFQPDGSDTVDQDTEFSISGGGELAHFRADPKNTNWLLAGLHRDESATESDLTVTDGTTTVPMVKTLNTNFPIEVSKPADNEATLTVKPGYYELHQAPSFYATLNDDEEVVGVTTTGVRTGVIWCDNIIKDGGVYISIDRDDKAIGLQEDDNLDPNITGGTPYIVHVRQALRGTAPADGYVQAYLRDKTTKQILEDWKGNPVGARKAYSQNDELGAIDYTFVKKYKGLEYFQNTIDDNLTEEILLGDRTNGNTCIMVQAIDTNKQTSTGILQLENDVGYNILWSAHFLGDDVFTLNYYLEEDRPLTTLPAGTGETGADGWHFSNWTQMKAGVSGKEIKFQDDGVNLVGYSFGKVLSNEKTEILHGSTISITATAKTPKESLYVYKAKWTGAPDQYTKEIVTDIMNDTPVVQPGWTLLPNPIFFSEDISGNPNTKTADYVVDSDAKNIAFLFLPGAEQSPYDVSISDFSGSVSPAVDGFYIKAKKEPGETYLEFSDEYFECGLTSTVTIDDKKVPYGSLRYTINSADTPMPAGTKVKGNAPITANWNAIGGAVDFLEFTSIVKANVGGTTYRVLPGESIPDGGDSDLEFYWSEESAPGVWSIIPESVKQYTVTKGDPATFITTPSFEYDAKVGSKLRAYAKADRDDGAYIESDSDHIFLCQTTITVKAVVPGSEDEPISSLYVKDELDNDWELTAGTDGHLRTLLVGDLPENTDHHVLRSNFSGNDFVVDGSGIITLMNKATKTEYTEISADTDLDDYRNYIVDTTSNTVTINIPYEQDTAFSVRDWKKKFKTNNCIITVRDEFDAIAHTATLNKDDEAYIFYKSGGIWKYGEIGKGVIVDIASDHDAETDFPDTERIEFENADLPASAWTTFTYPSHFHTHCPSGVTICDSVGLFITDDMDGIQAIDENSIKINPGATARTGVHIVISR